MQTRFFVFASLVLVSACSSGGGGAVNLSFGGGGTDFTTTPAGAAAVQGTFSASGDFQGQYTLSTSVPSGSPISTCTVAVDGQTPSASVDVDESTGKQHTLTVQIALASGYAGQAACDVSAKNKANAGIGTTVIIQVAGAR